MKKFILNFKKIIRFLVSILITPEFAFLYCLLGTVSQISHTYFLVENISSLEGGFKTAQAMGISVFISSSLLYFTAISSDEDTENAKKIRFTVTLFAVIEVIINIYYYTRHLILDKIESGQDYELFDFIFGVLVSCLIPITIKLYSSQIQAKKWLASIDDEENFSDGILHAHLDEHGQPVEHKPSLTPEEIDQLVQAKFDEKMKSIDENISASFEKNKESFINDFKEVKKQPADTIEPFTENLVSIDNYIKK